MDKFSYAPLYFNYAPLDVILQKTALSPSTGNRLITTEWHAGLMKSFSCIPGRRACSSLG
jgi:hypothetical protein